MKKLVVALMTVGLLLTLVPGVAYAAEGGVTGQGKGGNTAPTVTSVLLVEVGSDTEVTDMTPLTTCRVKVTAADINTIDDIQEIEFHVFTDDAAEHLLHAGDNLVQIDGARRNQLFATEG